MNFVCLSISLEEKVFVLNHSRIVYAYKHGGGEPPREARQNKAADEFLNYRTICR